MLESRTREGRYHEAMDEIATLRRAGEITDNISFRTIFEEIVTDNDGNNMGYHLIREMDRSRQGGVLREAGGDAMTSANFQNLMAQFVYGDTLRTFDNPIYIGDELVTPVPADTDLPTMLPGVTMIGDQAQPVGEGEEYPVVGFGDQYIQLPRIDKSGFILAVTEELLKNDRTDMVLEMLGRSEEAMAISVEKERLSVVLGITNTYRRNGGPAQNTYGDTHTEGTFDNLLASTALVDFTDIEASDLGFSAVTDPDTGEPIVLSGPRRELVPEALWVRAWRIKNAELMQTGNLAGGEPMMQTGNPLKAMRSGFGQPLTSPYVASLVGNSTTWFRGDFKGAFGERVYWPTQVLVEDRNSGVGFSRDIVSRTKVRRKTVTFVREPRKVQKLTQ